MVFNESGEGTPECLLINPCRVALRLVARWRGQQALQEADELLDEVVRRQSLEIVPLWDSHNSPTANLPVHG